MWQSTVQALIEDFHHPAWGLAHSRRVYALALQLAAELGAEVDEEALLAAAYLHDLGALGPHRQPGVDHAARSVQLLEAVLGPTDFPRAKLPLVQEIILGHTFHIPATESVAVKVFHDADILDFMGYIGVTRLLAIVGLDDWAPDLPAAVALIRRFTGQLPPLLLTPPAQRIGAVRLAEMQAYLAALETETGAGTLL